MDFDLDPTSRSMLQSVNFEISPITAAVLVLSESVLKYMFGYQGQSFKVHVPISDVMIKKAFGF